MPEKTYCNECQKDTFSKYGDESQNLTWCIECGEPKTCDKWQEQLIASLEREKLLRECVEDIAENKSYSEFTCEMQETAQTALTAVDVLSGKKGGNNDS